ncbi:MAG: hypothetical protein Q8P11_01630 [bacterium]|nr:hypothetical protein [bacterium]
MSQKTKNDDVLLQQKKQKQDIKEIQDIERKYTIELGPAEFLITPQGVKKWLQDRGQRVP